MKDKILQLTLSLPDTDAEIFLQNGFFTKGEERTGDMHCHQFYELHYVANGKFSFRTKDSTVAIEAGDLLILPPRLYHRFEGLSERLKRLSFEIRLVKKRESKTKGKTEYEKLFSFDEPILLSEKFPELDQLAALMGEPENEETHLSLHAYFTLAFLRICNLLRQEKHTEEKSASAALPTLPSCNDTSVIKALRYVAENHTRRLLLSEVALTVGLSPRHLERILKQSMAESFHNILTRHRISTAAELLREDKRYSLEQIASLSGFGSYVSFYHAFVAVMGKTPSEFRKTNIHFSIIGK